VRQREVGVGRMNEVELEVAHLRPVRQQGETVVCSDMLMVCEVSVVMRDADVMDDGYKLRVDGANHCSRPHNVMNNLHFEITSLIPVGLICTFPTNENPMEKLLIIKTANPMGLCNSF
jgi:hypothetical protein